MNIKILISFTLGCAAGAGVTYILTKKKLNDDYVKRINEAQDHFKSKYEAKLNVDLKEKLAEKDKEKIEKTKKERKMPERTVNVPAENVSDYENIIQDTDYSKFSKEKNMDNFKIKEGPYFISEEEYDDFLNIERFDLTYFKEDEVFMDSKELTWSDGLEKIGEDNLLKMLDEEIDSAFIINEDYSEGYNLIIDEGSYSDYMGGI